MFRNTVEDSGQMTILSVLRALIGYRLPSNQKAPCIQSTKCLALKCKPVSFAISFAWCPKDHFWTNQ